MNDDNNSSDLYDYLSVSEVSKIIERDRMEIELERKLDEIEKEKNKRTGEIRQEIASISRKYYQIANELVEDGNYYEAVDLYSKSIQISKRYLRRKAQNSIFNRAITIALMGFPALALQDLRSIAKCKPVKADVFYVMGQIYESLDKKWLARRMYEKSLRIDPSYWRAKNSLERRDSKI
ncbi:MAG: tetratricopeptide repeat protein [Thermoplasmata archaeon]